MSNLDHNKPIFIFSSAQSSIQLDTDCDCDDCACEVAELSDLSPSTPLANQLQKQNESSFQQIDQDFAICYSPFHKPVTLNKAAVERIAFFETPRNYEQFITHYGDTPQERDTFALMQTHQLIRTDTPPPQLKESNQTLSAWLHITDRCNLRCTYCYLPHLKKDMSWDIGKSAIDATIRSALKHQYPKIKLKYAGGEALLRFDLIQKLHQYAIEQTKKHQLLLDGVVLSNGTLLNIEIAHILKQLHLKLMISLDGLGQVHDAHRPYAGGRGTFVDVEKGIQAAKKAQLWTTISVTVSGQNALQLPHLVAWILEQELPFTLNFYRENELSGSREELQLEEEKIIDGMLAAYQIIEQNLPQESLLGALVDRANLGGAHLKTCGVGQSYLVFDYQGRVAKCQMHLDQPITSSAAPDPLGVIRLDSIGLQNISVEEKEGCRDCEWKYWCAGGCAFATFKATGRYDIQSPNCAIYKAIYPAAMRLEGLRLLQQFQQ